MNHWEVKLGDCVDLMAEMEDASVDAIVCDPPYGLEFMGKEWDSLGGGERKESKPGIGDRPTGWVSNRGWNAMRCRVCHHLSHGGSPCTCDKPDFAAADDRMQQMQAWHLRWATEALRVLKPGGHLLAFGGTRTYHRLACAVEDAGFEIRDSLLWMFGSGFPKSLDVSKAIDKAAGAEREITRYERVGIASGSGNAVGGPKIEVPLGDNPATPEAAQWEGWGTALKPAYEPIVVARKPLIGTVAQNVLEHGTGAINVDGCRVGLSADYGRSAANANGRRPASKGATFETPERDGEYASPLGRWPANVVLSHTPLCEPISTRIVRGDPRETGGGERPGGFADVGAESGDGEPNAPVYGDEEVIEWDCAPGCPVALLDAQSGDRPGGGYPAKRASNSVYNKTSGGSDGPRSMGDTGGASRFFYCAKTSRAERNAGLEGFALKRDGVHNGSGRPFDPICVHSGRTFQHCDGSHEGECEWDRELQPKAANDHPTVKPINLMRWLCRLVTPPAGLILDPFCGSGTTGCAAVMEGFRFVGYEREADYLVIAHARIAHWACYQGMPTEAALTSATQEKTRREAGQIGLLD